MSRLFKSNRIVMGEPLKIKDMTVSTPADTDKQGNVGDRIYSEIILKAEQHREYILDRAKKEAEAMLEQAEREREEMLKSAYNEGYRKGYNDGVEKGRAEGLARVRDAIKEAEELKRTAVEERNRVVKDAEEEIIDLVVRIARKILHEQVKMDREAILSIVKKALEKCPFTGKVIMKIAPEDYEIVVSSKSGLLVDVEGISELEVVMDNNLISGSCILETDSGYIDSSIHVQLDRIEKAFKELFTYEKSGT